jgi:hypothetical protein
MRFCRWLFWIAGAYGLLVLVPQYFLEPQIDPPLVHPEHFYGFVGVAVAWQVAFLIIGCNPPRYRLLMIPSVLEKFSFGVAAVALLSLARAPAIVAAFGAVDLALGALFVVAFFACPRARDEDSQTR